MTTDDRFARNLSAWLDEDGAHRVPDHLAEVLVHSAATRQRPWWSSPERWLPVDTTLRPRLFSTPSPGRLLAVAALILVLVAAAIFAIGAQQRRLPEPFGLARNGSFVETRDGDIYTVDPLTSKATLLIGGAPYDFGAYFSRDGTRFMFLRSDGRPSTTPGAEVMLTAYVANADGSDVRAITGPTKSLDWFDWSPDGTRIAYVSDKHLFVVDVATGQSRAIEGAGPMHYPTWLPPDGKDIVFRSETTTPAIFAIAADGTGKRRVLTPLAAINENDYQSINVASDGKRIAFTRWSPDHGPSVYALDLQTGELIDYPTTGTGERDAVFSPDASRISYARLGPGNDLQLAIANADGSGDERVIGPVMHGSPDGPISANWAFTPDGTALIVRFGNDDRGTTRLIPLDGSQGRIIETGGYEFVDVQRLAR
jgi:dipeptidyl aminopeptidase/acylaminoacyl peptidase